MLIRSILNLLIMPPAINLLLVALGVLLVWRYRLLGRLLMVLGVVSLAVLATPWAMSRLYQPLEIYPALSPEQIKALNPQRAILVVLGSGIRIGQPEWGGYAPTSASLERVNYAAHIAAGTGLQVVISGGRLLPEEPSEADVLGAALERMGKVPFWLEQQSHTTWENATNTVTWLNEMGFDTVVLVTDAFHMRRAVESFHARGVNVLPAPTGFRSPVRQDIRQFLPDAGALEASRDALHEWLGILVYRLSYGTEDVPGAEAGGVIPARSPTPASAP